MYKYNMADISYEFEYIGTNMVSIDSQLSSNLLVGSGGRVSDGMSNALRNRFILDHSNLKRGLLREFDLYSTEIPLTEIDVVLAEGETAFMRTLAVFASKSRMMNSINISTG